MKDEVEDFLRRVAQMRAQAEAQARAQQQRLVQPQEQQQPPAPRPYQPPQQRQAPPPQRMMPPPRLVPQQDVVYLEPVDVEIVEAEVAELGDGVGRHVSEHLSRTQQIAQHAQRLGSEVDLADDKLDARLHQTFDHALGQLKKTASSTAAQPHAAPAPDVTVSELLSMLRTPGSIREAVVMAEILRRPEW